MYVCAFVYVLTYVWHASLPHRAYTIYGNGRRKKSLTELRLDKCCTIKYAHSGSSCSCSLKGVELNRGTWRAKIASCASCAQLLKLANAKLMPAGGFIHQKPFVAAQLNEQNFKQVIKAHGTCQLVEGSGRNLSGLRLTIS